MKGYPGGRSANCGPSTAGRSWEGEVRERADDVFFALGIKRCQSKADFAPKDRQNRREAAAPNRSPATAGPVWK